MRQFLVLFKDNFKFLYLLPLIVMSSQRYNAPRVTEYGPVEAVTQDLNKDGLNEDQYTDDTNGQIVGSVIDAP